MARNRTISPDFWTWEAVIDCKMMTRLLFIGLWNFADDGGVQPLRPRTIRMQVFPGDEVSNEQVRAMIDELASRGLVRVYEVEGQEYVSVVDWEQIQRIGKRARRRFPSAETMANHSNPSLRPSALDEGLPPSTPTSDDSKPLQSPSSGLRPPPPSEPSAAPDIRGEKEDDVPRGQAFGTITHSSSSPGFRPSPSSAGEMRQAPPELACPA